MEFLQALVDSSQYAFVTALLLGLMTAISPCPLATNITAIGFIGRNLENKKQVFYSGLYYTLGRAFSYVTLALVLYFGVSKMNVSLFFQSWGEKLLGPVMIMVGVFMLDWISMRLPGLDRWTEKFEARTKTPYLNAFLLGALFALAFCPYSGVLFFALLVPMTIASPDGLYLPLLYALGTGFPVVLFAWLLAFAVGNVARLYDRIRVFERWFRRVVAILFLLVGFYFTFLMIF